MVTRTGLARYALTALGATAACQVVIGLEDKELDPKLGSGGSAGTPADASQLPKGSDPVPPKRPGGPAVPGGGATRWFAARTIYLGTFDPETDEPDSNAWRKIGHDVDGECTTVDISKSDSSSVCKKPPSATPESLEDGNGCRDNSAGRLLAVGIQVVPINFEPNLRAGLVTAETATYLLRLDDLGTEADDPYVRGSLYVSVPRNPTWEKPPVWDGTDLFAVDIASVDTSAAADGAPIDASPPDGGPGDGGTEAQAPSPYVDKPLYVFDKGYLSSNVWVSGDLGKSPMKLPLFAFDRITVVDTLTATLAVELTKEHDQARSSQLSVAVSTASIDSQFRPIAFELVNCVPQFANLLMDGYVMPARDLGAGPTLLTPGKPCDAESFAFAFEWKPVKPPVAAWVGPLKPPKCGGDGG